MAELNSTKQKFLTRVWSYYKLHDFSLPGRCGLSDNSLYRFVRCFENFSPHCTVRITPFGFEHLLCATLLIDIKPGAQEARAKVVARKRKTSAKRTAETRRVKRRSSEINRPTKSSRVDRQEEEHTEEDESDNDEDILDLPKKAKNVSLKICLDPCLDLLFSSRLLPQWLLVRLGRCLGVTGDMELISTVRGDPRHIVQLVSQMGGERDTETSSQAVMEHEWEAALQRRGRCYGSPAPLGPVTRMLGAMPNNFPAVQGISATYRKVPLSALPRLVPDADDYGDEARLQECRQKLASLRISSIKVHLTSPSLLHLYYNASREVYQAKENLTYTLKNASNVGVVAVGGEGSDDVVTVPPTQVPDDSDDDEEEEELMELEDNAGGGASAAPSTRANKKRKTKFNLEGVVTEVPFFIQRLRAKGTFRPVLEYK